MPSEDPVNLWSHIFFQLWKFLPIISSNIVCLPHRTIYCSSKLLPFVILCFGNNFLPDICKAYIIKLLHSLQKFHCIRKSFPDHLIPNLTLVSITFLSYYFLHHINYFYILYTYLFIYYLILLKFKSSEDFFGLPYHCPIKCLE